MQPVEEFTKVESIFIRHRNCLVLRGQFTPIYTDYYLHLMQHGLKYPENLDFMLKELLAMQTLHLVARPWQEVHAWTANLRAPRVNFFVTGGSVNENITGRLFTEDIREPDQNLFYSQVLEQGTGKTRTSTLPLADNNPLRWIEEFYEQSEQRPCRAFDLGDENYALLTAQPGFDEEWFAAQSTESIANITESEETKILETRKFRFHCGCDLKRILPVLKPYKDKPEELFQGDPAIEITCPRCNAKYQVTPEDLQGLE